MRPTGMGRSSSILDDMACCLMKLLRKGKGTLPSASHSARECLEREHSRKNSGVVGQASDRDPDMVVYPEHLLLVAS